MLLDYFFRPHFRFSDNLACALLCLEHLLLDFELQRATLAERDEKTKYIAERNSGETGERKEAQY